MKSLILVLVVVVVLFLILRFKYKISIRKNAEDRTSFEKILATFAVKHQQRMEEVANTVRTPEISRLEGIQRCKEAIRELEFDFKKELTDLIKRKDDLTDQLPKLKAKPGLNEGKARKNKKKMEEALSNGQNDLAEQYKKNAMMFLDLKKKSIERIEKSESFLREIKITIEKSEAEYEMRKAILDDTLSEFESMHGPISRARFNNSMELIQSLRRETVDKIRTQNSEIEASNIINDNNTSADINSSEYEDEFNKL